MTLKSLYNSCGREYLTAKMFFRLVKPQLYGKVIANALLRKINIDQPSSAILGLTYSCQCRCVHCSAGLYKNEVIQELSTQEWRGILDATHRLGVPRINLTGGEALLRKDIFDIIDYASKSFVVILESNGLLISREVAGLLKKAKVSCVAISIDSVKGPEHDLLRKANGCFDQALEGIHNLKAASVPCIMSTYIPAERANIQYIEDLMSLVRKMGVMALRILPPRPVGSFSCNVSSLLGKKDEELIRRYSDSFISYFNGMPAPKICGIFSKATFYISPYGDIQPCPFMPISFGNVKDGHIGALLTKMWCHRIFRHEGQSCLVLNAHFRDKYLNGHNSFPWDADTATN